MREKRPRKFFHPRFSKKEKNIFKTFKTSHSLLEKTMAKVSRPSLPPATHPIRCASGFPLHRHSRREPPASARPKRPLARGTLSSAKPQTRSLPRPPFPRSPSSREPPAALAPPLPSIWRPTATRHAWAWGQGPGRVGLQIDGDRDVKTTSHASGACDPTGHWLTHSPALAPTDLRPCH